MLQKNTIKRLKRSRHPTFYCYMDPDHLTKVYECHRMDFFKIKLFASDHDGSLGEVNFMIRDRENPDIFVVLYCLIQVPGTIFKLMYWKNNLVRNENMGGGGYSPCDDPAFIDDELFLYLIDDFMKNFLADHYVLAIEEEHSLPKK